MQDSKLGAVTCARSATVFGTRLSLESPRAGSPVGQSTRQNSEKCAVPDRDTYVPPFAHEKDASPDVVAPGGGGAAAVDIVGDGVLVDVVVDSAVVMVLLVSLC